MIALLVDPKLAGVTWPITKVHVENGHDRGGVGGEKIRCIAICFHRRSSVIKKRLRRQGHRPPLLIYNHIKHDVTGMEVGGLKIDRDGAGHTLNSLKPLGASSMAEGGFSAKTNMGS